MSHVKNLQSFDKVIRICTGLGGNYNPGQQNLQVNAMTTMLSSAQQILDEVQEAQTAYDFATNNRVLGFKGIRTISSGVISLLRSSGAHKLTVKDAVASNRKIWGARAKPPDSKVSVEGGEAPKSTASYGRDYATIAYNFSKLVMTVEGEPKYRPNEPQLTVDGLKQRLAEIEGLNDAVTQAEVRLSEARRKRNALYYEGEGSMFQTALATKFYVRGVFGFRSAVYTEVQRINFTKPHA